LTLSGALTGSGGLTLGAQSTTSGSSSILYVTNTSNTFLGDVRSNNGAIWITNVNQLGTGTKTILVAASGTGAAALVLDGTSGNITLPSTFSFQTSSGTGVSSPPYLGIVNVAGNNEIAGSVTMIVGGGDSYFTVNGGSLTISGTVTASTTSRAAVLGGTGSGSITGVIGNTNTPEVVVLGSSTWTLSNTNTYAGGTTLSDTATVVAGNTSALGTGAVTMSSGNKIKTLSAGGQNGKLAIGGAFSNTGGTICVGG
jgi:autotransporter-associated beta strand protein